MGLFNDWVESLNCYERIQTALDICQQSIVRRVGPFVISTSSNSTHLKLRKDKVSTCTLSSAHNMERKRRSRVKERKIRGLSPHPIPPPVSVLPRTSTPVTAERQIVFLYMDARPPYREASLRGLQQSWSGDRPCSPDRVKPRGGPPSTPTQGDLQDCLVGRQQQMSRAQSRGTNPWNEGGVGHSGGGQSSSHHKRTNQGHSRSSPFSGPPRPAPSATITSGALAASGHSGQNKWQPEEWDRSVTNQVRYHYCCSIKILRLSNCLNPCKGLSNKNCQFLSALFREVCQN